MRLKEMNLYIEGAVSGGNRYRLLNIASAAAVIVLAAWVFSIWREPLYEVKTGPGRREPAESLEGKAAAGLSSYSVIAEKDLFSPLRRKYVAVKPAPKAVVPPPPPPPPPRKAPPRLTLIGTVLLDDGEAAMIEHSAGGQKAAFYRIGDMIDEFVVKDIRKDFVVLERDDGMTLKVMMHNASPAGAQPERAQQGMGAVQSERPSDIPSGLVPRPQARP